MVMLFDMSLSSANETQSVINPKKDAKRIYHVSRPQMGMKFVMKRNVFNNRFQCHDLPLQQLTMHAWILVRLLLILSLGWMTIKLICRVKQNLKYLMKLSLVAKVRCNFRLSLKWNRIDFIVMFQYRFCLHWQNSDVVNSHGVLFQTLNWFCFILLRQRSKARAISY